MYEPDTVGESPIHQSRLTKETENKDGTGPPRRTGLHVAQTGGTIGLNVTLRAVAKYVRFPTGCHTLSCVMRYVLYVESQASQPKSTHRSLVAVPISVCAKIIGLITTK